MRKIVLALLLAVMCLSAVCGCQPTPETPVVVGKNEGDNKVTSLFGETSETEGSYTAPESWKEEEPITSADLTVMIDAKVTVPDVTKFPVVKVTDHVFTQEEADEIIANLSEGNELFPVEIIQSRASKEKQLLAMKARLAELKAIENPSEAELIFIEKYETNIPLLEAEIKAMPEGTTTAPPLTTKFQPSPSEGNVPLIVVTFDLGGGHLSGVSIRNGTDEESSYWGGVMSSASVNFGGRESNMYSTVNEETAEITKEGAIPNGTNMTREEVLALAGDMMRKAGIKDDMRLVLIMPISAMVGFATDTTKQAWMLRYAPVVNGIPVASMKLNVLPEGEWFAYPDDETETAYNAVFSSPAVFFEIDETGVWMNWSGPIDIQETLNENAVLLPFDKIQERIKQQLPIKYAAKEGITQVHVTSVELNYMRARIKDTQDGYMLVPVWDVYGYNDQPRPKEFGYGGPPKANPEDFLETLLTISAIDGSVMNRNFGY